MKCGSCVSKTISMYIVIRGYQCFLKEKEKVVENAAVRLTDTCFRRMSYWQIAKILKKL